MKTINVPYGNGIISGNISDSIELEVIDPPKVICSLSPIELAEKALDNPINSKRIEQIVKKTDKIVIIMNDATRPSPNVVLLECLMKRLEIVHVPYENIKIVIATGTHKAPTEKELKSIIGERYYGKISVVIHDWKDETRLKFIGNTESGLPVWINSTVAEADIIITTGLIAPHQSAGFSGGRKSIVPGVAGYKTLKIHHSLPIRPLEPSMGILNDNKFHQTALEAAKLAGVDFIFNAVQDLHKQNIAFVAGELDSAHRKGSEICLEHNKVKIRGNSDIVVVSPGGYPRDSTLYQAQKALPLAELIGKKKNPVYILCANAEDGIGGNLLVEWLSESKKPEDAIEKFIKEGFETGTNKVFLFARALKKGKIIVVSQNLKPNVLNAMMMECVETLQEALDIAIKDTNATHITVLPRAVSIIPEII